MAKLLIHTCCSDCVLKLVAACKHDPILSRDQITLYYDNPNIHPEQEWLARMQALKVVAKQQNLDLVVANWQPARYFDAVKILIDKGVDINDTKIRCPQCYRLRLEKTVAYAVENGYEAFSTTMLTSSYLDTTAIQRIGSHLAETHQLKFIVPKAINTCLATAGFYKQNYCGCVFSLKQRLEEKYL